MPHKDMARQIKLFKSTRFKIGSSFGSASDSSVKFNKDSVLERNSAIEETGEQVRNSDEVDPNGNVSQ